MMTILIFIILLGLLVFVHELGHFLTAIRNGIRVDEFGFGFPPRLFGVVKDENGKFKIVWGSKEMPSGKTVYSLNWIPLGGFVKIAGEDGHDVSDPNSFASKSAWVRIKVLGAGVFMNFLFAWFLIAIVLMLGMPQPIEPSERGKYENARIQVLSIGKGTPAETMGLTPGDALIAINGEKVTSLEQVSQAISSNKGKAITVDVDRFGKALSLSGTPRTEYPANEGALGISFSETAVVSYPWYEAIYRGAITTYNITMAIFEAFGKMIASLFGAEKTQLDVTGPVGIVYLTKQMSDLGLAYLLQFAALLSINLGIINILPIPALDGGRILFILIEKLKGSPVSRRIEGMIHQVGFILLLLLMLLVTIRDFSQFQILEKLTRIF